MTDDEFKNWLEWHFAAFRNVEKWLAGMPTDDETATLKHWRNTLRPCELQDCCDATESMHADSASADTFPSSHPARVREMASMMASKRHVSTPDVPMLGEATPGELDHVRTNIKYAMRVAAVCRQLHDQRSDARYYEMPLDRRRAWAKRFIDATISVSKDADADIYAQNVVEAITTVNNECLAELRQAATSIEGTPRLLTEGATSGTRL